MYSWVLKDLLPISTSGHRLDLSDASSGLTRALRLAKAGGKAAHTVHTWGPYKPGPGLTTYNLMLAYSTLSLSPGEPPAHPHQLDLLFSNPGRTPEGGIPAASSLPICS